MDNARFYYKREQPPELQRVHIESTQKKYYIRTQKRPPKQTRNILVRNEHNLFRQQDRSK